jgi:hypothetical protein
VRWAALKPEETAGDCCEILKYGKLWNIAHLLKTIEPELILKVFSKMILFGKTKAGRWMAK